MGVLATEEGGVEDIEEEELEDGNMVERTPVGDRCRRRRPRTVDS